MNRFAKQLILLFMIFFLQVGTGYSDTVLLRNGDRLIGVIQNEYFVVQGSFSQITVKRTFCKNIIMESNQAFIGSLKTINNDSLTGTMLDREIQILLTNQTRETVSMNDLKSLFIDAFGPNRQVTTTIFTTRDGSRFSGKLLNPEIKIRTEYMAATYQTADINRIEFEGDKPANVSLLLSNGDFIHGNLLLDKITIQPDSFAQLTVDQSEFSSIQFNASKLLLKEFSSSASSEKDSDRDGVPDDADSCPDTPWGDQVDAKGCSTGKIAAKDVGQSAKKNLEPRDKDGDSVVDTMDQCPRTPAGVKVDNKGCWLIKDILFDFDVAGLKPQYYPVLDEVAVVMQRNPMVKIEIQGSTDNIGTESYNIVLSQQRAQNAKNYLLRKGIESHRITAVGYGTARNKASNENAAGRALNRRVDFMVVE
jgi:outer membrane protein OmpA-like peptidoglycan-associated protein